MSICHVAPQIAAHYYAKDTLIGPSVRRGIDAETRGMSRQLVNSFRKRLGADTPRPPILARLCVFAPSRLFDNYPHDAFYTSA